MSAHGILVESGGSTEADPAMIGPNSVIQTLDAIRAIEGDALAEAIRQRTQLPFFIPARMIPERWFTDLIRNLRCALSGSRAEAILSRSGIETANYVIANRIPRAAKWLLKAMPSPLARPLLLRAIHRHAWTFAGAGQMRLRPSCIELLACPTCRQGNKPFSGGYYAAAFQRLLSLADPHIRVQETECVANGNGACAFTLE